jgi:MFS family permease
VLLVVKDPKAEGTQAAAPAAGWKDFGRLFTMPAVVLLALVNLLLVGPLEGFADVWGVQYLGVVYALDQGDAAWLTSLIFVGMLVGGPLLATLARWLGNLRLISFCGFGMAALFALLLSGWLSAHEALAGILLMVGILCCYQVLVFAAGARLVRPAWLGVTVALLNCINMLGGSFFHTAIGLAMDRAWTGQFSACGLRHYDATAFQQALQIIPVCAALGGGLAAWLAFRHARRRQAEGSSAPV